MGEIQPARNTAPTPGGDGARYTTLQNRLTAFAEDLGRADALLAQLAKRIEGNAERATGIARRAAESDFDSKPVRLAEAVGLALGGNVPDVRRLARMAAATAQQADNARHTHQRLYGRLHNVRSQRTARTPKPGAFNRPT
ncbi:conjugal transfer protein TraB [Streptomyces sp. TRM43335]|uniref:Conjugal transfer protein TraB n=1 Tax=Streptomyces taklimakanensis TaxID=2569853 RepID=A0A6G2BDL1_9ACTN|nr:conjugal transfer protein TraB [Streptomyces taklimakanensis]MTE20304.1 conjugal transfer protein TraB [Streptomyces taklimakanensis]